MVTMADAYLAFSISLVTVTIITGIVHLIVKSEGGDLLNIIRGDFWVPSLSLFQFFAWTIVIAFSFFGIYLLRIFEGEFFPFIENFGNFPSNLLLLMGISVAVPIISIGYTRKEYEIPEERPQKLPPFSMMFQQKGRITLNRFQMFLWTWIGIIIYLMIVFGTVSEAIVTSNITQLSLPNVDSILVALMGLSQVGYLGGRFVSEDKSKKKGQKKANAGKTVTRVFESEEPATPGKRIKKIRRMPDDIRELLVQDQDTEIRNKILMIVDGAEIRGLFRYYIIGNDFYYLIQNGQIRGAGKNIPRVESMKKINLEKEEIGPAELFEIE
jgi:hypothetical protein